MGTKLDKQSSREDLNNISVMLNDLQRNTDALYKGIISFSGEKALKGRGIKSAQKYFHEVHGSIAKQILMIAALARDLNSKMIKKIGDVYLAKKDIADKNEVEKELKNTKASKQQLTDTLNAKNILRSNDGKGFNHYDKMIKELENVITSMEKFDGVIKNHYDELENKIKALKKTISKLKAHPGYNVKLGRFPKPKFNIDKELYQLEKVIRDKKIDVEAYDPVNMATGNYIYNKSFLKTEGSMPMEFILIYNSADPMKHDAASAGWLHNYHESLDIYEDEIIVNTEGGRQESYDKTDTGYISERNDKKRTLKEIEKDGIRFFEYINEKEENYIYDVEGRCIEKIDEEGQRLTFTYEDDLLTSVENAFGQGYHFTYEVMEEYGYIKEITDHGGRKIVFGYEEISEELPEKRLISITDEEGEEYAYSYDEAGRMCAVTNARGIKTVENTYDVIGRTVSQEFPDGGIISFDYHDSMRKIKVTEQNGNEVSYYHDDKGRSTETVYDNCSEKYTYDDHDQMTSYQDKRGNITKYEYDERGNREKETDPLGNVLQIDHDERDLPVCYRLNGQIIERYAYNDEGNIVECINGLGHSRRIEYERGVLPVRIIREDGTETNIEFDDKGNAVSMTDGEGNRSCFEYDELGRTISATDANGNREEYRYNKRGELVYSRNAAGDEREYRYNESGKLIYVKDYDGNEEYVQYNELNKPAVYIDKEGKRTEYEYNEMWDLKKVRDPKGAVTLYHYDKHRNLTGIMDACYGKISYEHDESGNIIKETDQEGNETIYEYDELNRRIKTIFSDGSIERYEYDASGNETKFIDAAGGIWTREYDLEGQLIKENDPEGNVVSCEYDAVGNMTRINEEGRITEYCYDAEQHLTKAIYADGTTIDIEYDGNGNMVKEESDGITFTYGYDCLDQLVSVSRNGVSIEKTQYDKIGNITKIIDALGNETRYERTRSGMVSSVIDAIGNVTRYRYDEGYELIKVDQGSGRITEYTRDKLGRLTEMKDPLGNITRYEYDKVGNVIKKTDADGNETRIIRDHFGDIAKIEYADSKTVEYSYTKLRQLKQIKDSLGVTVIERDCMGREVSVTDPMGNQVRKEYGIRGTRTALIYPDGTKVSYGYDEMDRLTAMKVSSSDLTGRYEYDDAGRLSKRTIGDSIISYDYDDLGRLSHMQNIISGQTTDSFDYQYDNDDNIVSLKKERKGLIKDSGVFDYRYDELGRLTEVKRDKSTLRSYSYDAFGNRTVKEDFESNEKTLYTYDAANQLLEYNNGRNKVAFAYDKRGNMVKKSVNGDVTVEYVYGAGNRLDRARKKSGETAEYIYDARGMRAGRKTSQRSISYIFDHELPDSKLMSVKDSINGIKNMIWDEQDPAAMMGENGISEVLSMDHLGTPIRISREGYAYDEFGVPMIDGFVDDTCSEISNIGYTGYIKDGISETYFAQAREYIPETGRFAGRDIIKGTGDDPRTLNEYAYCYNSPLKYVDLDGRKPKKTQDKELLDWYRLNESIRKEIPKTLISSGWEIKLRGEGMIAKVKYRKDYRKASNAIDALRKESGNVRAGTGRKSWLTRRENMKLSKIKTTLPKAQLTGAGIGAAFAVGEASLNYYSNKRNAASNRKKSTDLATDIAAGIFIVGLSFVPGIGILLSLGIAVGYSYNEEKIKNSVVSLD